MGKNKNKSKRDRLLRRNKNGKIACCNSETNSVTKLKSLVNPHILMTEGSENYGIRHLLEKTMGSRKVSVPDANPNCIDLSKDDVLCEKEVIDLTETSTKSVDSDVNEPAVIDITEEETNAKAEGEEETKAEAEGEEETKAKAEDEEETNAKSEGEEDVCVIGTYTKPSPSLSLLSKPLVNDGLGELIRCKEKVVVKNWLMFRSKNGSSKMKKKYKKRMLRLEAKEKFGSGMSLQNRSKENFGNIGSNMYVNSPLPLPSSGLRPIIIDGNNVAYTHSSYHFCCKRLEICINYFKEKGHKVTAFVPQFRTSSKTNDDPKLLKRLEREGYVVLTPSKEVDGKKIVPYDDRFIVQTAVLKGGIIVSRDNYKDLLPENPAWADTIKYRTLAFTWVDDILIFPEDPLGEFGPKLEEFLRFH